MDGEIDEADELAAVAALQDVKLGQLDAGAAGMVSVVAGRDILDARDDTVGHDGEGFATQTDDDRTENIIANEAQLTAGRNIGQGKDEGVSNPLDISDDTLAATSANSSI